MAMWPLECQLALATAYLNMGGNLFSHHFHLPQIRRKYPRGFELS